MTVVDAITVFCAQILPLMVAATAAGVWLLLPRRAKGRFALASVVALALTAAIVLLAGTLHADPRPFVVDPSQPALLSHAPDNGFPSDHTAYAATIALLVALVRRRLGIALLGLSIAAGAARVLANVHHVQDIAAGLLIAATAVAATFLLLTRMWNHRLDAPKPINPHKPLTSTDEPQGGCRAPDNPAVYLPPQRQPPCRDSQCVDTTRALSLNQMVPGDCTT